MEKWKRVTTRGKGGGKIRGEAGGIKVATIEALTEMGKEIMTMSQRQEDFINKFDPSVRFRVF